MSFKPPFLQEEKERKQSSYPTSGVNRSPRSGGSSGRSLRPSLCLPSVRLPRPKSGRDSKLLRRVEDPRESTTTVESTGAALVRRTTRAGKLDLMARDIIQRLPRSVSRVIGQLFLQVSCSGQALLLAFDGFSAFCRVPNTPK